LTKPANTPCPHLETGFRCDIHSELRERGFRGCTVYDCSGAGQQVSQVTFGGRDWREHPELAGPMFAAFGVMRRLHDLLWSLHGVLKVRCVSPMAAELGTMIDETRRMTAFDVTALLDVDLTAHARSVQEALGRAGDLVSAAVIEVFDDHAPREVSIAAVGARLDMDDVSVKAVVARLTKTGALVPSPGGEDGQIGYRGCE